MRLHDKVGLRSSTWPLLPQITDGIIHPMASEQVTKLLLLMKIRGQMVWGEQHIFFAVNEVVIGIDVVFHNLAVLTVQPKAYQTKRLKRNIHISLYSIAVERLL